MNHAAAISEIAAIIGSRLSTALAMRDQHGRGEAFHAPMPPDAVAFVESAAEVQAIMRVASTHRLPVIAFGAGSSLEGNVAAPHGGLALDMTRMDRIIAVDVEDMDCTIEPGVTREALNSHLRDTGLFFPIDPGANATLGGMAATRASGTNAVRYGTMREAVLWLEVVLADGRLVRTARRARKSSAGFDLTRLFVGSEGTLGITTAIGLRLHGQPETIAAATCQFERLADAVTTVVTTLQMGVPMARIELMDAMQVRASNRYSGTALAEKATLLFEFHGSAAGVREQVETVAAMAGDLGGEAFAWAETAEARTALWKARHNAYHAAQALRPGSALVVTDVCVPISRLTECIIATAADVAEASLLAPIVGHVGDGNFHVMFNLDPCDAAELAQVRRLNDRLVARALAMDGTCTGEHGIGLGKMDKLIDELGLDAVNMMRGIKASLDPLGILNPGKIFQPA